MNLLQPLDPYVEALLNEFAMAHEVRDLGLLQMNLTLESYRHYWKTAKENTLCYPVELSSATVKAGATDKMISFLELDLLNIALKSGYSPERWKKLMDVMILKKSGVTHLSSLRTIVLFPVDCNFAFKHIGWEMMKAAEATYSSAPEQYDSRKYYRAIDLAVCKHWHMMF